jgi:YVTN family beta-propeller protein
LAWDPDGQVLYAPNYNDNSVTIIDVKQQTIGTFPVGSEPAEVAWDGERLWVTLAGDNAVVAYDKQGNEVARVPLDNSPNGVTFDGTNLWVAIQGTNDNPGSTVTRINVAAVVNK